MSRVFIGRLPHSCRERDLERFFRGFGRIREVNLKTGYAFVEFEDYKDADDAVYEMNGRDLLGERVVVELARSSRGGRVPFSRSKAVGSSHRFDKYGPPVRTDYRLTIDNLSSRTSWQDLKDFIRGFGCEVTYADAHKWRRNEGTVSFASGEDMKRAARKLDGVELDGRRLKVYESGDHGKSRSRSRSRDSKSPRHRSRSGSASRSRSPANRDRSRSRSRSVSKSRSPDDKDRSPSH